MKVTTLFLLTCELCLAIRVPVNWDESASEVKEEIRKDNDEQFNVESFTPQNVHTQDETPIPVEYFQYTAKKPQFAVDIAKFHGVQTPENHYKAYSIKPITGKIRPQLGKHHLLEKDYKIFKPLQEFANINEDPGIHAVPVSSNYEVFHPYAAETPALQEIYKDPILTKIRNDLESSKNRLQAYEKDAGEPDIHKEEYLQSPENTDSKFVPQRNIPAPYEIHRPQRRPIYYRPVPKNNYRENYLNQRLKHPWNQYSAKIRPLHYRPVKNHIQQLRQNHALKYDDERNEYPQVQVLENYSSDPKDGYDIYERGKDKFLQLRNNVDESINKAVKENRPATYGKLEMQKEDYASVNNDEEEEFVPLKNYAQVRKFETYKHLPKSAAFDDAESFDEIRNAPRLREAVKSTKAQTVYSEEGYEDSAYDHAGEQKHASENEGHGGYLKEHELSGGKFKTPSESAKYEDEGGSVQRDQVVHAEKWKDDNKDKTEEIDEDEYSEDEHEKYVKGDEYNGSDDENHRNKREFDGKNDTSFSSQINETNDVNSQELQRKSFVVPELNFNSTYLTEDEILKLSKIKIEPKKEDINQKYPYYLKKIGSVNNNSPLRYSENLKLIPKKSKGGTEFYDSRSTFECPEVDDVPDPLPEKLKRDGHPDETTTGIESEENSSSKGDENYNTANKTPRLKGLGDKIDCFKAKYFGENPLDSPFFKEEVISNPEPVTLPNLDAFKLTNSHRRSDLKSLESKTNMNSHVLTDEINDNNELFRLIEKLRSEKSNEQDALSNSKADITEPHNSSIFSHDKQISTSENTKNKTSAEKKEIDFSVSEIPLNTSNVPAAENITYKFFQNIEDITQPPHVLRKKRSSTFVYEPYKIIRDSQVQDSKKTTTTSNISPLIRQLQSSRIVDKTPKVNLETEPADKYVKRNINSRVYKDIGKRDREPSGSKNDKELLDSAFVDVSVDSRRGEPRYEIRRSNHKSRYTPVENKKAMSIEDYKAQTSTVKSVEARSKGETGIPRQTRQKNLNARPFLQADVQTVAASSNIIQKKISTTTKTPTVRPAEQLKQHEENSKNDEDYEEYDDEEEEEEEISTTTTTTTTEKPIFRRRIKLQTTTETIPESTEEPRLKLVTRFRDYRPEKKEYKSNESVPKNPKVKVENIRESDESTAPKYREKKKKSTKSTLVTDTKRYGNDDDDMRREEVDALIGVKQDMNDYTPLYEKEENKRSRNSAFNNRDNEDPEYENNTSKNNNDDEEEEDDDSDDEEDSFEENDDDDSEEDEDDDENDDEESGEDAKETKPQVTTPEPTKRTLAITTDAPSPTTATRNAKLETKPIITRKKIEIHKELPANRSAPHVTQFKQDIKEVEIIKEIPTSRKRKQNKNLEALELYKDDNLAKDVNKLGGVEIFKEGLNLKNGPKHGGNYRSLELPAEPLREARKKTVKDDAEASQSEFTKHVELDEEVSRPRLHGGNLRALNDIKNVRNRGRSAKIIELSDQPVTSMHGGNLKHRGASRPPDKSQKLIEFDDTNDDDRDTSSDHESFSDSANSGPMHGGNYRTEQLVAIKTPDITEKPRNRSRGARRNSAAILNSFVQAAPIFTSTPAYILDPSKRMYYYVDA